jgi:hypothetical protein
MESLVKTKKPQNRYLGKFSKKLKTSDTSWNFKNYCAKNSGSPEVELRFCPWLKIELGDQN